MAANAHEWLIKAWVILSEPSMKALLDRNLMMEEMGERKGETFWTRCPKCSYFYEYEKTFKDCLLRCQNIKCRGTFKAEQLSDSASPPAELLNRKVYVCYGFAPAGLERESEGGGRGGWRWWASPYPSGQNKSSNVIEVDEGNMNNVKGDGIFDVSDNVEQDKDEVKSEVENGGYSAEVNGEKEKVNVVEKEKNGGGKIVKKRTKMMARTIKKIAGRGTRVKMKLFSEEIDNVAGF